AQSPLEEIKLDVIRSQAGGLAMRRGGLAMRFSRRKRSARGVKQVALVERAGASKIVDLFQSVLYSRVSLAALRRDRQRGQADEPPDPFGEGPELCGRSPQSRTLGLHELLGWLQPVDSKGE